MKNPIQMVKQCVEKEEPYKETTSFPIDLQLAVTKIKSAILHSQYRAVKLVTGEQLSLYFGIGAYVSANSREGVWGTGAISRISEQLRRELPGLRGFSAESIKKMRSFFEYWQPYINRSPMAVDLQFTDNKGNINIDCFAVQNWSPVATEINREEFLSISFSHHMEILNKTKDLNEILFYIHQTVLHQWDKYDLRNNLKANLYATKGTATNNFAQTMPIVNARKAVGICVCLTTKCASLTKIPLLAYCFARVPIRHMWNTSFEIITIPWV